PFNVPFNDDGSIRDTSRIDDALPTIEFLRKAGAQVILMSHMSNKEASLAPVAEYLRGRGIDVELVEDLPTTNNPLRSETSQQPTTSDESLVIGHGSSVMLLENLRR